MWDREKDCIEVAALEERLLGRRLLGLEAAAHLRGEAGHGVIARDQVSPLGVPYRSSVAEPDISATQEPDAKSWKGFAEDAHAL